MTFAVWHGAVEAEARWWTSANPVHTVSSLLTLNNGLFSAQIRSFGAELASLRDLRSGTEYIWQADPKWWGSSAPILFPIVCALRGDSFEYEGKSYTLPRHGLARRREWTVVDSSDTHVRLALTPDEEFRANYPFDWRLETTFTLLNDGLKVDYAVSNPVEAPLWFHLGSHPAVNLPWHADASFGDYVLEFSAEEPEYLRYLEPKNMPVATKAAELVDRRLSLAHELFTPGALVLANVQSRSVRLSSPGRAGALTMDLGGAPWLGLWQPVGGAPFLCLEPWYGVDDHILPNPGPDLTKKSGIRCLAQGETFTGGYAFHVEA